MDQVSFTARKRDDLGSRKSGRIRRAGRIPAVVYGSSGQAFAIDMDALEFSKGIRGISESTIVKINIDGVTHEAFVKDTQRNVLNGQILHIDFYEIDKNKVLRTRVLVHTVGVPIGSRVGGILEVPLHELEVECLPKDLPEKIEVDVSALEGNQSIHVRDLKLSANVKILSNADQVVATVKFAKAEVVEAEAEAAATGTAPAAGAASAAPAAGATPAASAAGAAKA